MFNSLEPETSTSPSALRYLVAIGDLEQDASADRVSTTALADRLGVSPASASTMVRRLAQDELVEHRPYHGATTTPTGRALVSQVRGRQALLTQFLAGLGLTGAVARAEAARLEPCISDVLLSLIAARLDQGVHECPTAAPAPQHLHASSPTRSPKEVVARAQP